MPPNNPTFPSGLKHIEGRQTGDHVAESILRSIQLLDADLSALGISRADLTKQWYFQIGITMVTTDGNGFGFIPFKTPFPERCAVVVALGQFVSPVKWWAQDKSYFQFQANANATNIVTYVAFGY